MKKSTLLSLLTAGAILVTSAGTYALWDTLEATSNGRFTVANSSIKLSTQDTMTFNSPTATLNANEITYSSNATFTIDGELKNDLTKLQLTLVPTVTKKSDGSSVSSGYTVSIKKGGSVLAGNVDKSLSTSNTYTVEVTVTDASLAGVELNVELVGTISEQPAVS